MLLKKSLPTRLPLSLFTLSALCAPLFAAMPSRAAGKDAGSAEQLFAGAKFNQAHAAFDAAIKRDPKNIAARLELIRTSLRLDNWKNALTEGQSAVAAAPQNADAHGLLGMALMRGGRPQKAEAEANKALALNPKSYWGLTAKGRVLIFNEQEAVAHDVLLKAFELHPEWPDATYYLHDTFNEKTPRAELDKTYKAYMKGRPSGHPHDRMMDSRARDVSASNPFAEKKNETVFEAVGNIDEKRLKAADAGTEKPVTIQIPFERLKTRQSNHYHSAFHQWRRTASPVRYGRGAHDFGCRPPGGTPCAAQNLQDLCARRQRQGRGADMPCGRDEGRAAGLQEHPGRNHDQPDLPRN